MMRGCPKREPILALFTAQYHPRYLAPLKVLRYSPSVTHRVGQTAAIKHRLTSIIGIKSVFVAVEEREGARLNTATVALDFFLAFKTH